MESFEEELASIKNEKYFDETFGFLDQFNSPRKYKIKSVFETIDGLEITLSKGERYFKFEAGPINSNVGIEPVQYQSSGYGYTEDFELIGDYHLFIKGGASVSLKLKDFSAIGKIPNLQTTISNNSKSYFRYCTPVKVSDYLPHLYIKSEKFKVGQSFSPLGFIKLSIFDTELNIVDHKDDRKQRYLFIDSCTPIEIELFKEYVNSILYCSALLSGYLPQDEYYILRSKDHNFVKFTGVCYQRLSPTIYTKIELLSATELRFQYPGYSKFGFISQKHFSELVQLAIKDKRVYRAIKIIVEGNELSLELKTSAYCVALETIKNVIIEDNQGRINPIKKKKWARGLIKQIKALVEGLHESNFNDKKAIIKKIENLNQIGNRDSFIKCFELLEIPLNDDDIACIDKRNDFLHGRIPFEEELQNKFNSVYSDLKHVSYKLHMLTGMLVLKLIGFDGLIKNSAIFYAQKVNNTQLNEQLFRSVKKFLLLPKKEDNHESNKG